VCNEPHTAENLKRSHYKELTIVSRAPDGSMTERKQKFCVTMQSKERDRLVAQAWKHLLGLIRDGHHGELPDVPRYISLGIDSNTQLERFASIANTSWVEAWHNPQKESAPHGVGMVYADLVLHMVVERANDHAKIKYKKGPDFG